MLKADSCSTFRISSQGDKICMEVVIKHEQEHDVFEYTMGPVLLLWRK